MQAHRQDCRPDAPTSVGSLLRRRSLPAYLAAAGVRAVSSLRGFQTRNCRREETESALVPEHNGITDTNGERPWVIPEVSFGSRS